MPATLVMLHGSNGAGTELQPLVDAMRPHAAVETPNLLAHGGRPVPKRLGVREMADDVLASLDERNIVRAFVFGYSFGAYLGLYLARHFPHRVCGICTLAVKYVFDERAVRHLAHLTNPERLRRPGSNRPAELTKTHHPQDWVAITTLNRNLFMDLGTNPALTEEDLRAIALPALIISAEQDQIVPLAETVALGNLIQGSEVKVFRGQAHPLSACPIAAIAKTMGEWMRKVEGA